jgi:peptide/nickel transport system substrate-binding protein
MRKVSVLFVGLGALLLLLLAACAPRAVAPTPTPKPAPAPVVALTPTPTPAPEPTPIPVKPRMGGVLRFVPQGSLRSLDPMWTTAWVTTKNLTNMVYETPFALDEEWRPQPFLLEDFKMEEGGAKWTFKLRSGLTFHNGDPVKAVDVVESFLRFAGRDRVGRLVVTEFGGKFEVVDDLTFTLTLKEPLGVLPYIMIQPAGFRPVVMHKKVRDVPAAEGAKEVIGTGPFKFVSWAPGDRYVVERWDAYKHHPAPSSFLHGRKPVYIDRLEAIEIPDHATRVAALEAGGVDFLDEFSPVLAERVERNPALTLHPAWRQVILVPNHSRPPFNDQRVREALVLAYPVEKALRAIARHHIRMCSSMAACGSPWEAAGKVGSAGRYNALDVARAKRLVAEAGMVGATVRLLAAEDVAIAPVNLVTREVLEDLGFRVDYQAVDWATVVARRADPGLWEIKHTWLDDLYTGVLPSLNVVTHKLGWFQRYEDPTGRMSKAIADLFRAPIRELQVKAAEDMARVFWEEVPYLPIGEFSAPMASRKEVKGYIHYSAAPLFWHVWLDR